jgi:hypothetical protein
MGTSAAMPGVCSDTILVAAPGSVAVPVPREVCASPVSAPTLAAWRDEQETIVISKVDRIIFLIHKTNVAGLQKIIRQRRFSCQTIATASCEAEKNSAGRTVQPLALCATPCRGRHFAEWVSIGFHSSCSREPNIQ